MSGDVTARGDDTPARREVRDRINSFEAELVNNADRAELFPLINAKLTGQQKRDVMAFVRLRMKTKKQAANLRARLESL